MHLRPLRSWLLALTCAALAASDLAAQIIDLDLEVGADDPAAHALSRIIERGDYRVLDRDTVLDADFTLHGDLIVLRSRVSLEGRVEGDIAVIRGDFFLRPGSSVTGTLAAIDGGIHSSDLAEVGSVLELEPGTRLEFEGDGQQLQLTIRRPTGPGLVRFPFLLGFTPPTHDRVNGLSLYWSTELSTAGDTAAVSLRGTAAYHSERERLGGLLRLQLRPTRQTLLTLEASRATRTADTWIRDDLENSLASLFLGSDVRNYFESDAIALTLTGNVPSALIEGDRFAVPFATVRLSEDRSLAAGDPWSLWGNDEPWRPNPSIEDGFLGSVELGLTAGWQGATASFFGGSLVEWAPGDVGDFEFTQLRAHADWAMQVLFGHQAVVSGNLLLPLGAGPVPRQRWSHIGGPESLPTFDVAAFRGDHLVLVQSLYTIPLRRVRLPLLGNPAVRIHHAVGSAWRTGIQNPAFEQNIGAGLEASIFHATVYVNPAERPLGPVLSLGGRLPLN